MHPSEPRVNIHISKLNWGTCEQLVIFYVIAHEKLLLKMNNLQNFVFKTVIKAELKTGVEFSWV